MCRALALLFFSMLTFTSETTSAIANSRLTFSVDQFGQVAADAVLDFQQENLASTPTTSGQTKLWLVALPFAIDQTRGIRVPGDVKCAVLDSGSGFTLLILMVPAASSQIALTVKALGLLLPASDQKLKFSLDASSRFMPETERSLLQQKNSITNFDIAIELPEDYPDDVISFRPLEIQKFDQSVYGIPSDRIGAGFLSNRRFLIWLTFPDVNVEHDNYGKLVISLFFGSLSALTYLVAMRSRSVHWLLAGALISTILVVVMVWYAYTSQNRLAFLAWAAGLIPLAVVALGALVHFLIANRFQAVIGGMVQLAERAGTRPARYARLGLYRVIDGRAKRIGVQDLTGTDGHYEFKPWTFGGPNTYRVEASLQNAVSASATTTVAAGKKVQLDDIILAPQV
jgi:hypothetical protein